MVYRGENIFERYMSGRGMQIRDLRPAKESFTRSIKEFILQFEAEL